MKTILVKKTAILTIAMLAILILNGTGCVSKQNQSTYWEKYRLWDKLRKGVTVQNEAHAKALLAELSHGLWLVKFKPVNGFNPRNASEFLNKIHTCTEARSKKNSAGGASFFRTTFNGKILIGSFLSETPEILKKDFSKCKTIQFISSEAVTPEIFIKYVSSPQESLSYNSKTSSLKQESLSQSAPPTIVVDTFPKQGKTVDAATVKELRVTFSNDMNTSGCWAFCSDGKNFFPGSNGKPYWKNKRTCIMPIKLIPGRTYSVTFNVGRFIGFYDIKKRPTVSYKLIFKTSGKNAETSNTEKPKVVKTFPSHGELVDASAVKEVRVTFSQDMNTDGHWSFFPRGRTARTFAKSYKKIHWLNKRTCVIPVKLQSGKNYSIWFNMGRSYRDFINIKGNSAIPYHLNFSTNPQTSKLK